MRPQQHVRAEVLGVRRRPLRRARRPRIVASPTIAPDRPAKRIAARPPFRWNSDTAAVGWHDLRVIAASDERVAGLGGERAVWPGLASSRANTSRASGLAAGSDES